MAILTMIWLLDLNFSYYCYRMRCQSLRSLYLGLLICLAFLPLSAATLPTLFLNVNTIPVPMSSLQRIHVFFTGKVQGVGFRQTARDAAVELGLKGWIKNLPDMRVEMIVEGAEGDLRLLMDKLRNDFDVENTEISAERPMGAFKVFEIVQ
jgi:acylphosphatase